MGTTTKIDRKHEYSQKLNRREMDRVEVECGTCGIKTQRSMNLDELWVRAYCPGCDKNRVLIRSESKLDRSALLKVIGFCVLLFVVFAALSGYFFWQLSA